MPRYRLMVPMVITMDDRLKRVTSKPLNRPHSRPTPRPMITSSGVSTPAAAQKPITVELSAIVEATDRSISRAIISIAIGRTTIAFSVKVRSRREVPDIEEVRGSHRVADKYRQGDRQ